MFSSVIPLDTKAETTEIWRMAHMFGARCSTELTGDITHVVAAKVCDLRRRSPVHFLMYFISVGLSKLIWQEKGVGSILSG